MACEPKMQSLRFCDLFGPTWPFIEREASENSPKGRSPASFTMKENFNPIFLRQRRSVDSPERMWWHSVAVVQNAEK
jgi:hypothetical protein